MKKVTRLNILPAEFQVVQNRSSSKKDHRNSKTSGNFAKEKFTKSVRNISNNINKDFVTYVTDESSTSLTNNSDENKSSETDGAKNNVIKPQSVGVMKPQSAGINTENSNSKSETCLNNNTSGNFPELHACNCSNCVKWSRDTVLWYDDEIDYKSDNQVKQKVLPVKITKPSPFLKKQTECKTHFNIETCQPRSHLEQEFYPPVLIHGFPIPEPRKYVTEESFHPLIQRALRKFDIIKTKDLQSYTWPAILANFNVCAVGTPKSGKTMMYLPCMASVLLENADIHKKFPNSKGPAVVIICSDIKNAEIVFRLLKDFLEKSRCIIAISLTPFDEECLQQFNKKCDALVTTPSTLRYLLTNQFINLKRLCHVVFDDFDKILEGYYSEINELLEHIQTIVDHRSCEVCVQYIITSECWTLKLENILKKFYSPPLVCMKAHLEAAVYGKINFKMEFLPKNTKESKLLELLKDTCRVLKTIVICNTDEEIVDITKFLKINGLPVLDVESFATRLKINEYEKIWKNADYGKYMVLICTDQMFDNSSLRSADLLIHYSLPDLWSDFTVRHKVFLDKYVSPLVEYAEKELTRCKSIVFVDKECENKIVRFVTFLKKLGISNLPEKYHQYCLEQIAIDENNKCVNKIPLCHKLKLLGKCFKMKCAKRHVYCEELDVNQRLSQEGLIKFKIITVHNPVEYTVWLIDEADIYDNLKEALAESVKERRICVDDIQVGDWLLYFDQSKGFCDRCEVMKILETNDISNKATLLKIKLLDSGEKKEVSEDNLFELPDEFKRLPSQGIHIYLASMVPPLQELYFNCHSTSIVKKKMRDYRDEVFVGSVLLQLNNCLWVENVHTTEHLPLTDETITRFSLSKFLINKRIVTISSKPLNLLYQLCGKEVKEPEKLAIDKLPAKRHNFDECRFKNHWAFLPKLAYEDVVLTCVVNPGYFFVSIEKFQKLLKNLEKDIEKAVTSPLYKKQIELKVGGFYVGKMPNENKYCRIKLLTLKTNSAYCLFLDYGKKMYVDVRDIHCINENMITQLPFQAIECRLFGIIPVNVWNKSHGKFVWEFCTNSDGSMKKLHALTADIGNNGLDAGDLKYSILLGTYTDEIILNTLLVENGTAKVLECEDYDIFVEESNAVDSNADFSESDFDFYDADLENLNKNVSENPKTTWSEKDYIPIKAQPLTNSHYYTPMLYWYETESNIKIKIQLSFVKDYVCKLLRSRIFYFSTEVLGKTYVLSFLLFKSVKKIIHHVAKVTYVEIVLEKKEFEEWRRLLFYANILKKHVRYDPSHLADVEDEDNQWKAIEKFKAKMKDLEDENDPEGFIDEIYDSSDSDLSIFSDEFLSSD